MPKPTKHPEPVKRKRAPVNVSMDVTLRENFESFAQARRWTMSTLVEVALVEYVARETKKKKP